MHVSNRWVLLEHQGDPHDPLGLHFDLLLEDGEGCRSWRLRNPLVIDGPRQLATAIPKHDLCWLVKAHAKVSGGRGWAKRIFGGFYMGSLPANHQHPLKVELHSKEIAGLLEIEADICQLTSFNRFL